jgi:hypothetical protein
MRLAITGGREFKDRLFLRRVLDSFREHHIISAMTAGKARGADTFAEEWAADNNIRFDHGFRAEWSVYGDAAGPLRNQAILDIFKPDCCIAFPGETGTNDMITRCKRYKRLVNPRFVLIEIDMDMCFL